VSPVDKTPSLVDVYLPPADGLGASAPSPPICCTVPEQSHPPPATGGQSTAEYPAAVRRLAAPEQSTFVDDTDRHDAARANCSCPVVLVLSVKVPSELAIQVPLARRNPVTGADGQLKPMDPRSRSPEIARHDDFTVQVPTGSPPQGFTLEHDASAPSFACAPEEPPGLVPLEEPPPSAPPSLEKLLQPAGATDPATRSPIHGVHQKRARMGVSARSQNLCRAHFSGILPTGTTNRTVTMSIAGGHSRPCPLQPRAERRHWQHTVIGPVGVSSPAGAGADCTSQVPARTT
jgi:hypothetical protein